MDSAPVDDAPAQRLPTAALAYKFVQFVNKMVDDKGSGADRNLSSWRPTLPANWFYLGQAPSSFWNNTPSGIIVQALEADALKDVSSWERVWDDGGSGKDRDLSLWRGIPPNDDYVVVGGIFSDNGGWAAPTWNQTQGIKAVRKDLLVFDYTSPMWKDTGSEANHDGSVWTTSGRTGIAPNALIPVRGHDAPPQDRSYSLDSSKVLKVG